MYRIFCESYQNYVSQYNCESSKKEYRYRIAEPFKLLVNPKEYLRHKKIGSNEFMEVSDLLAYMEKTTPEFPKFDSFLWTLESREITGKHYGVAKVEDLKEQAKLMNMFLNLMYWY